MYDSGVLENVQPVPTETVARHGKAQVLLCNFQWVFLEVKLDFAVQQAIGAHTRSRSIGLLFL
jgi:hypothetical protein